MANTLLTKVVIPAPAPGGFASRVLLAGAIGLLTHDMNAAVGHAGSHGLLLNEMLKVPSVCNACGTNPGTKHKVITQNVTFSELGNALGGSLMGQTRVEFRVPVCESCVSLRTAPGVSLESYAKAGKQWNITLLVANRAVAELYAKTNQGIIPSQPVRSADGRRVAHLAKTGGKMTVVVDGVEGKPYDGMAEDSLAFSPDSQRLAYGAKTGERWTVVADGVEGRTYDGLLALRPLVTFSPDSQRLAYGAKTGDKIAVVVDGVEGKAYDGILDGSPAFSPDGARVVYGARFGAKWAVVLDGVEGKAYDSILNGSLVFSPDSAHVSYDALVASKFTGDRWITVTDGIEGVPRRKV